MTGNRPALRHNKQAAKRDSLEQVYWRKRMPEYQNVRKCLAGREQLARNLYCTRRRKYFGIGVRNAIYYVGSLKITKDDIYYTCGDSGNSRYK